MTTSEGHELGYALELAHLSWLIGTWAGVGLGQFPTIDDFRFGQEVTFATDGRPFLSYWSRSWELDDEGNRTKPRATEAGFLRPRPDNEVEMLLAHPSGYAEVWVGTVVVDSIENAVITGAHAELHTDVVARTGSAKEVTGGTRLYGLREGDLLWAYDMAAVGQPLTNHLSARLKRVT